MKYLLKKACYKLSCHNFLFHNKIHFVYTCRIQLFICIVVLKLYLTVSNKVFIKKNCSSSAHVDVCCKNSVQILCSVYVLNCMDGGSAIYNCVPYRLVVLLMYVEVPAFRNLCVHIDTFQPLDLYCAHSSLAFCVCK